MSVLPLTALAARGVQFKVLSQIFPVLRHEVVGPLSNATLAAAMLRQSPDGANAEALQQRCHRLAGDLTGMLDDSVNVVRELDQWLADNGAITSTEDLLRDCRKLMFSHLLLSRHSIIWPEDVAAVQLPQFSSRYLLLAWLLCLLRELPADAGLTLDFSQAGVWRARFPEGQAASAGAGQADVFDLQEVELLAAASGWRLERQAQCWSLHAPAHPL
ncbi:hypothetical protein RAS12_29365 [Achromobacter seleniivolatilans]|uniref:Uncharacterized protein n=1 Tax=Achromobacter seleniivolatilans TaxID=3047478 RepID=A0ABY9M0Y9_9BURK|nr:hypothetical protein [Achromobacter sp. R39]WMD20654.1 hypothetical protein RAS12_29365 [Achromobacter sp. R39]